MRDILAGAEAGDEAATLAFDVYVHRLRAYAGAYLAQLGGVDVISFTAGVGENAPRRACRGPRDARASRGSRSTPSGTRRAERGIRVISTDASRVTVLVVPTNEELEIARQTLRQVASDPFRPTAGYAPAAASPLRWHGHGEVPTPSLRPRLEAPRARQPCPI